MYCGFTYEIRDETNPDLVYYGSSELPTLDDRMKIHIQNFNAWKNNKINYCSSYRVLELGNYKPTLLKIVFFTIKWELHKQERLLIEYQTCVNNNVPNRTPAEYREANRDKILKQKAEWREANKDKIKEQRADYYQDNKEKLKEQHAEYREANKDKIKEQRADHYQVNKDKLKEQQADRYQANKDKLNKKFNCPCGGKYTHQCKAKHIKTKIHQDWLKTSNTKPI
jgi:hypothetical protein